MCCQNEIPSGAAGTTDVAGKMIADGKNSSETTYTPTKIPEEQANRAKDVINFFTSEGPGLPGLTIEIGIGIAGIWSAESGIDPTKYNAAERKDGYAFKNTHAPNAKTFKYPNTKNGTEYYMDQATMMKFGYGKGIAQWSWSRNLKFRDWYNSGNAEPGLPKMDVDAANITATSIATQTAFAWKEMSERTGEFLTTLSKVAENSVTKMTGATKEEKKAVFNENVTKVVDAVLRGYENGSRTKMASVKQMNAYSWSGGYSGSMKTRVSRALGIAEALKDFYYEELSFLR